MHPLPGALAPPRRPPAGRPHHFSLTVDDAMGHINRERENRKGVAEVRGGVHALCRVRGLKRMTPGDGPLSPHPLPCSRRFWTFWRSTCPRPLPTPVSVHLYRRGIPAGTATIRFKLHVRVKKAFHLVCLVLSMLHLCGPHTARTTAIWRSHRSSRAQRGK